MDFSWLTKLIPSLKDLANYFFPVAIVSTVILFASDKFLEQLGLVVFREQSKPYLGAVFLFSWAVVVCKTILGMFSWVRHKLDERNALRKIKARLNDLSTEEKNIIGIYLEEKSRTLELDATNHAVVGLLNAGIVDLAILRGADAERAPCTIPDKVWEYINLHQDLIHHDRTSKS